MATAAEKSALGLDPDASEDEVTAAIVKLQEAATAPAPDAELDAVAVKESLGLAEDASPEEVLTAVETLKESAETEETDQEGIDKFGQALGAALAKSQGAPSGETRSVVVAHKAFSYRVLIDSPTDPSKKVYAERLARRGDKVDVLEDDYQRGSEHGAFETERTIAQRVAREIDIDDVSDGDLIRLIKDRNLTVNQTVALAGNDPERAPEKAKRLLKAENGATGNDPRAGVITGLTAVISRTQ